jgi:hypothetical protein
MVFPRMGGGQSQWIGAINFLVTWLGELLDWGRN